MRVTNHTKWITVFIFVFIANLRTVSGLCFTVDCNGTGDFITIQEAIDAAWDFDCIIVNPGKYVEHINYYGKAISLISTDPNDPNIVADTIIDGNSTGNVVTFNNWETELSLLSGFTIRNGINGIYLEGSGTSPIIEKCVIHSNTVGIQSSGRVSGSDPCIVDCIIEGNSEAGISECYGTISHCIIRDNGTDGFYNFRGVAKNSVIQGNNRYGVFYEALGIYGASGHLKNCIVSGNGNHGILYASGNYASTSGIVTNCTIVGNKGDGIQLLYFVPNVLIENSIITRNLGFGVRDYQNNSSETINFNDLWGNRYGPSSGITPGISNIYEKPWFANSGFWDEENVWYEGDYHLRSTIGRWDPVTQEWVIDPIDSPCIVAGNPDSHFLDEPYPNGGRINMGAYGGTSEASMSEGGAHCTEYPEMDFNHDCKVDQLDLDMFMEHWLECNLYPEDACNFVIDE